MVYKHAVVAAFHIYAQSGEDAAKRGGWTLCIKYSWKLHCCSWKIMEKSWNCVFELMWEPRLVLVNHLRAACPRTLNSRYMTENNIWPKHNESSGWGGESINLLFCCM